MLLSLAEFSFLVIERCFPFFPFTFHVCLSSLKKDASFGFPFFLTQKFPKHTTIQEKRKRSTPTRHPFIFRAQQRRQNPKIYRPTVLTHHDISWAKPAQGWSPVLARSMNFIDACLAALVTLPFTEQDLKRRSSRTYK